MELAGKQFLDLRFKQKICKSHNWNPCRFACRRTVEFPLKQEQKMESSKKNFLKWNRFIQSGTFSTFPTKTLAELFLCLAPSSSSSRSLTSPLLEKASHIYTFLLLLFYKKLYSPLVAIHEHKERTHTSTRTRHSPGRYCELSLQKPTNHFALLVPLANL